MLPALNAFAGLLAVGLSVASRDTLPIPAGAGRAVGSGLVVVGAALVLWSGAVRGAVASALGGKAVLATGGPFRLVRHPAYLGFTTALTGVALTGRSAAGLVATILLFLPLAILRARAEDAALSGAFGPRWLQWAERTPLMLPGVPALRPRPSGPRDGSHVPIRPDPTPGAKDPPATS